MWVFYKTPLLQIAFSSTDLCCSVLLFLTATGEERMTSVNLSEFVFSHTNSSDRHIVSRLKHWNSAQFSHSVLSDSLRPHGLQHARPPCPSPTPGVYSNSCLLSRRCHSTISSSVIPFSSCLVFHSIRVLSSESGIQLASNKRNCSSLIYTEYVTWKEKRADDGY